MKYLETTCIIIAWCGLLSLSLAVFTFVYLYLRKGRLGFLRFFLSQQPALICSALAIFLAYQLFQWVLFFPVHLLSGPKELIGKALVPALVLLIASGFIKNLILGMKSEYDYWSAKAFLTTAESFGIKTWRWLGKLVILRSLAISWGLSLPWLFAELIIVESIFNAPGLGLDIWFQARHRDFTAMFQSAAILASLYACCAIFQHQFYQWLGKRLEGYL